MLTMENEKTVLRGGGCEAANQLSYTVCIFFTVASNVDAMGKRKGKKCDFFE